MNKLGKFLISLFFILTFTTTAVVAQQTAVDRAVTLINKNLILNDYDKAYNYAKFVINYYSDDTIPDDIVTSINEAISERGKHLADNEQWDAITTMEQELQKAPQVVQNALKPALKRSSDHFKQVEEEKEKARIAAEKARIEAELAEQERLRQLEEEKRQKEIQEQEEKRKREQQEQEEKRQQALKEQEEKLQREFQAQEERRLQEEKKQKEREAAAKAEKDAEFQKILDLYEKQMQMSKQQQEETSKQQLELEQKRQDMEQQRHEVEIQRQESELQQQKEIQQTMSDIMVQINENNTDALQKVSSNNKMMFIGFGILVFVFVAIIVFIVILIIRQSRINQENMKNTILTMQAMRVASPAVDMLPLTLQMENMKLAGPVIANAQQTLAIENDSVNPGEPSVEQDELKNLFTTCKKYGDQIDMVTGRKNVTSRVAELVFKISQKMGYSESDCILFYAAALVYDIGFLSIDSSILRAESLTSAQYEMIKTHTTIGPNMVFFVDEKYRDLFREATGKHHENLDGSGYPEGLKGQQIPYIARVLRVVESYIAIISSRSYKTIGNRDSAIQELKNTPKHYDQDIVTALDEIV